jgi:ribonuclease PH
MSIRPSKRNLDEIRDISIKTNINNYAEGSCLISFGNTQIICTASVEEKVPHFLRNKGQGWITANYNMLARSTHQRIDKDPLKPNARNMEIQRLISRSLRFAVDLNLLGERQITIDCDVIQADGSTRCASITGGFVALSLAIKKLLRDKTIDYNPMKNEVCAVSCGIYNNQIMADLDYLEDSKCEVDCNFVLNKNYDLIEIQGTAEAGSMTFKQVTEMYELAKKSAEKIIQMQRSALQ